MDRNVGDVIKEYRTQRELSQAGLAEALASGHGQLSLSRQAISQWEAGETEPSTDLLLIFMIAYSDWRMQLAIDALCTKLPDVFARDAHGNLTTLKPYTEAERG